MTYQPKTSREQRELLVDYHTNRTDIAILAVLQDLATCETALAEEKKRREKAESLIHELVDIYEAMDDQSSWGGSAKKADELNVAMLKAAFSVPQPIERTTRNEP